jgi:hypothetical protein
MLPAQLVVNRRVVETERGGRVVEEKAVGGGERGKGGREEGSVKTNALPRNTSTVDVGGVRAVAGCATITGPHFCT